MFDKKDMMVSLTIAEQKVNAVKEAHKMAYQQLKDEYADFINKTKAIVGVIGIARCEAIKHQHQIGYATGFIIDGIDVYTGDELILISSDPYLNGKVGIATMVEGQPYWRSNAECGFMQNTIKYQFARHFVHYKDGDEIAKGRKGHSGYVVSINKNEVQK